MLARLVLFVLMAAGLAGFGAVAWISLHPVNLPQQTATAPETAPPSDQVSVLVAARTLRAGGLLKPEDLTAQQLPAKDVPPGARTDTQAARSELLGAMIRRNMAAGEVVLPTDALNPGDRGFLAAVLGPGMRAVTVGVDAISGLAGLIWPGDRVDLILTQSQNESSIPPGRRTFGETVLHDARVIAIDHLLMQGATSESPEAQAPRTVTLEVTPSGAERVVVATKLGHLALSVVAITQPAITKAADGSPVIDPASPQSDNGITWGGDVSSALRRGPGGDGTTVRLYLGPADSKEIHF
jgi:pilus assembly protein CpaB